MCVCFRTWPGVPYFPSPSSIPVDLMPSVSTRTTAAVTTTRCTVGHLSVVELRDAAVKVELMWGEVREKTVGGGNKLSVDVCVCQRFEQLLRMELSQSEEEKHERLKELQRWNTHWRQQINPLKNMV